MRRGCGRARRGDLSSISNTSARSNEPTLSIFACKLGGSLVCMGAPPPAPFIPIGIGMPPRPRVDAVGRGIEGADTAESGAGRKAVGGEDEEDADVSSWSGSCGAASPLLSSAELSSTTFSSIVGGTCLSDKLREASEGGGSELDIMSGVGDGLQKSSRVDYWEEPSIRGRLSSFWSHSDSRDL